MEFPRHLLEKCQRGDCRSQKALYHFFSSAMYGVCLRYFPNPAIAQDILQDGFIRVFEGLRAFRFEGSLEGWIKRIMVNTALEYHRRKDYDREVGIEEAHLVPSRAADHEADYGVILSLVEQLPQQYRLVFNLYAIEGYSHPEIAQLLSITVSTSKSNYSRARSILRDRIHRINRLSQHAIL